MADIPKIHSSPPLQHQVLEPQDEPISSQQQTLDDDSGTNCSTHVEDDDDDDDDDLVNVADPGVPYTFVLDPFSPLDSSFFIPPSSSSYHHRHNQVNSNSCSCCSSESESESDYVTDYPDSTAYPDCLYGRDEEYDQMDFITDLFESRSETDRVSGRCLSTTDVGISVSEGSVVDDHDHDFVSNNIETLGLGLGVIGDHDHNDAFVSNNIETLGLGLEGIGGGGGGLRVARIESDSDTEDLGADQNENIVETTDSNPEHIWDCPSFDTARVDDRDRLSSVIDRIEEISVSSDISSEGDAAVGVLEWEILLAVNNLERNLDFATDGEEGFVYTPEFDTLIGQFVETVRALRGSPPTAKSFIDNLPLVAFKKGDAKDDDDDGSVTCAVCKDEISMEERVAQLPCKHHYHGECIVPWLSIRNTCPVCRFELPTDDVDYERSKNRVNDDEELRVGYGFDLSP